MNILIVDDEIYAMRAICKNISWKKLGFDQVHRAFNAAKAKEIFRMERIDIMITDIEMPVESGLDLIQWVREQGYDCAAICLTCHTELAFAQRALRYGMFEYIVKPVDFVKLAMVIKRAAEQVKDDRKKKALQEQGLMWAANKQAFEDIFWEELVTGKMGKGLADIIACSVKMQTAYDFIEQYLLILFVVRRIYDHAEKWRDEPESMKGLIVETFKNIFQEETVQSRTGWLDQMMWAVVSPEQSDGRKARLDLFLDISSDITGAGVAAYLGEVVYGETLHDSLLSLLEADNENVSIEQGIVKKADSFEETGYMSANLSVLRKLLEEKDWGGLESFLYKTWYSGRRIDKEQLHCEREAVGYEIYRFLEKNHIDAVDFWKDIPIEKTRERHRSVECFAEWVGAAIISLRNRCSSDIGDKEIIASIKLFIEQHIETKISREQIAEHAFFSTDYVARIFKQETGYSLNEYITEKKMDYARKWIEEGNETIGTIAVRLGYNSRSYFTEIFRRLTGYTPSDYKRKCAEGGQKSGPLPESRS